MANDNLSNMESGKSIYDFTVKNNKGEDVKLSDYKGKVLLVVNTATKCGLTPQYKALEEMYEKYKDRGFEILDFPCNQFMDQAPGSDEEITQFCTLRYGTTFPRFKKIDVNGENTAELYRWLKKQAPNDKAGGLKSKVFAIGTKAFSSAKEPSDITWNFGKFLINKNGIVSERFSPATEPQELEKDIEKLISE